MWKVVSNLRSDHIYIKDKTENTTRTVALIPMGRIHSSEQIYKDAALIAQAPEMKQLLMEIKGEGYLSFSLEKKINRLLESDRND